MMLSSADNERGVALIITLLVVALLTIAVIDFTYSAEVDAHMAHNALNGLQAELLARSGINLGEAFLLHDNDPTVDAFTEEWCPQPGPGAESCLIDESNGQLVLPDNMRLRVEILDEGGKLNINLTRPPSLNVLRYVMQQQQQRQQQQQQPGAAGPVQPYQAWGNVFVQLAADHGVDPEAADELSDYWTRLLEAFSQVGSGVSGQMGLNAPLATPTPSANPLDPQLVMDFPSLDDASIVPGLTPDAIRRLRPVVTALPQARQGRINVNTAPPEVLNAVIGDGGAVDNIISARQQAPITMAGLAPLLAGISPGQPMQTNIRNMLGVQSAYFLIRASAIVNPNPVTGLGGVSRSASMLVLRAPNPRVPFGATALPAGMSRWTLTQLDWQKEAGAALFTAKSDDGSGTQGGPTPPGG